MVIMFRQHVYYGSGRVQRLEWVQLPVYAASPAGKGRFVGDLKLDFIDGHKWRLLEPFSYISRMGNTYTADKGMLTDFASIPRFLWSILPPTGLYGPAAVIHDMCCNAAGFPRDVADDLFYEMLTVLEVPNWQRWTLYRGVRIGAWWGRVKNFLFRI